MKMFDNLTNLNQDGVGIDTPPSQSVECGYPKQQKPLDTTTPMHFLHFNLTCSKFQLQNTTLQSLILVDFKILKI